MKQTKEQKLLYLAELAQLDPLLVLIPHVVNLKAFGKLIKTFEGQTIKFPSMEEIRRIIKKTKKIRTSLRTYIRKKGCGEYVGSLYDLALNLESAEVRKASKICITKIILHQYFKELLEDDSFEIPVDKLDEFDTTEAIELYKMFLKDMNMRTNIIKSVENIQKQKTKF